MKSILSLFVSFILTISSFSQNLTSVYSSPTAYYGGTLTNLLYHPLHSYKFLMVESIGSVPDTFYLRQWNANTNVISYINMIYTSSLSTKPIYTPSGILFGGYTNTKGTEPVLFWGGVPTIFDVRPGSGSSDPEFFQSDGRTFFVGKKDVFSRELFEYISPSQITQVSNENQYTSDVTRLVGVAQNNIYFQSIHFPNPNSPLDPVTKLKKAEFVSGSYVVSTLRTKNGLYSWNVFGEVANRVIVQETKSEITGNNYFVRRLLSYDNSDMMMVLVEDSSTVSNSPIYGYHSYSSGSEMKIYDLDTLYSTNDGLTLINEFQPASTDFHDHFFYDSNVYFITSSSNQNSEINKYVNGGLTNIYTGKHIHPSITVSNKSYFTDFADTSMSKIIELSGSDQVVEWNIKTFSTHPYLKHVAMFFEDELLFLWSRPNSTNASPVMDIHRLNGFLDLSEKEDESKFRPFPNPLNSGENLIIELEESTDVMIADQTGRIVMYFTGKQGVNTISTIGIQSGLYYIRTANDQAKFIVK